MLGTRYTLGASVVWRRLYPTASLEALPPALAALVEDRRQGADHQRPELLVLSARTPEALRSLAQATLAQVTQIQAPACEDLCYSASRRREHLEHRLAVVARGTSELGARLQSALAGLREPGTIWGHKATGPRPRLAFV